MTRAKRHPQHAGADQRPERHAALADVLVASVAVCLILLTLSASLRLLRKTGELALLLSARTEVDRIGCSLADIAVELDTETLMVLARPRPTVGPPATRLVNESGEPIEKTSGPSDYAAALALARADLLTGNYYEYMDLCRRTRYPAGGMPVNQLLPELSRLTKDADALMPQPPSVDKLEVALHLMIDEAICSEDFVVALAHLRDALATQTRTARASLLRAERERDLLLLVAILLTPIYFASLLWIRRANALLLMLTVCATICLIASVRTGETAHRLEMRTMRVAEAYNRLASTAQSLTTMNRTFIFWDEAADAVPESVGRAVDFTAHDIRRQIAFRIGSVYDLVAVTISEVEVTERTGDSWAFSPGRDRPFLRDLLAASVLEPVDLNALSSIANSEHMNLTTAARTMNQHEHDFFNRLESAVSQMPEMITNANEAHTNALRIAERWNLAGSIGMGLISLYILARLVWGASSR